MSSETSSTPLPSISRLCRVSPSLVMSKVTVPGRDRRRRPGRSRSRSRRSRRSRRRRWRRRSVVSSAVVSAASCPLTPRWSSSSSSPQAANVERDDDRGEENELSSHGEPPRSFAGLGSSPKGRYGRVPPRDCPPPNNLPEAAGRTQIRVIQAPSDEALVAGLAAGDAEHGDSVRPPLPGARLRPRRDDGRRPRGGRGDRAGGVHPRLAPRRRLRRPPRAGGDLAALDHPQPRDRPPAGPSHRAARPGVDPRRASARCGPRRRRRPTTGTTRQRSCAKRWRSCPPSSAGRCCWRRCSGSRRARSARSSGSRWAPRRPGSGARR